MNVEFDPAKDAANRRKHGVSLTLGAVVLAHLVGEVLDPDDHGGEDRWIAYGMVGVRLYVCVYTPRSDRVRLISVRRATSGEEQEWLR